jgi:hypothetical protein
MQEKRNAPTEAETQETYLLPSRWASYLINNESSGMDAEELQEAIAWRKVNAVGRCLMADLENSGFTRGGADSLTELGAERCEFTFADPILSSDTPEQMFLKDVRDFTLEVARDQDESRHLRFFNPKSGACSFEIVTWVGTLVFTGDMGTYVFSRNFDMFAAVRALRESTTANNKTSVPAIAPKRWGSLLSAVGGSGITEFNADKFRIAIAKHLDYIKASPDLRDEVETDVLAFADDGAESALSSAYNFQYDGVDVFQDCYEWDVDEYTTHYLWCCFALAWAVAKYDALKVA